MKGIKLVLLTTLSFLFLLAIFSQVSSLGLNYRTTSIAVRSGDSFCIDYYLFNTAEEPMSGYLSVEGDLIKFLPYYSFLKEKTDKETEKAQLQDQMNNLTAQINVLKNNGGNYTELEKQLGIFDAQMETLESEISNLEKEIEQRDKKNIIEVQGMAPSILTQYTGDSAGLRQYIISNNLLKQAKLCLKAPEIEKEIQGDCYTKYYDGQAVLIPIVISNQGGMGSEVAMRVSAPLNIRVRCGKNESIDPLWIIIIIVAAIIVIFIIVMILKNKKKNVYRKKW